jgi:hypothetical protein
MTCPRCNARVDFLGTRAFHGGPRSGLRGYLAGLFGNAERFDVYVCPTCGRVEPFVDGAGE